MPPPLTTPVAFRRPFSGPLGLSVLWTSAVFLRDSRMLEMFLRGLMTWIGQQRRGGHQQYTTICDRVHAVRMSGHGSDTLSIDLRTVRVFPSFPISAGFLLGWLLKLCACISATPLRCMTFILARVFRQAKERFMVGGLQSGGDSEGWQAGKFRFSPEMPWGVRSVLPIHRTEGRQLWQASSIEFRVCVSFFALHNLASCLASRECPFFEP